MAAEAAAADCRPSRVVYVQSRHPAFVHSVLANEDTKNLKLMAARLEVPSVKLQVTQATTS